MASPTLRGVQPFRKSGWFACLAGALSIVSIHAATLAPGDPVDLESLKKSKWLQGEAPTRFVPGKVYVFECWATWCGPCMAMIPHMNELHKKYHDRGLLVHGMNVMENDLPQVKATVKNKKMSYPVAFTGGDKSPFDRAWLQPAGVSGIPVAFVVIDGKLVRMTHPKGLTDTAIEEWLATAAKSVPPPPVEIRQAPVILKEFQNAQATGNATLMKSLVDELQKSNPKAPELLEMKVELLVARKDWSEAAQAIEVMAEEPGGAGLLTKLIQEAVMDESGIYPPEWLVMLANTHDAIRKTKGLGAMDHVGLSMLYWRAGDRDKARKHAADAAAQAEKDAAEKPDPATVAYFAKFAESVAAGNMPSMKSFHASMPRKTE